MEREATKSEREMLNALPKDAIVGAPPEDGQPVVAQEEALNAVIVGRTLDDQGNLSTPITLSGDVKVTEVETILKLALKSVKQTLGV